MSTPVNYYIGVRRGEPLNIQAVQTGTSTLGSAVDVELRMQIDNGTAVTNLKRKDVVVDLKILLAFLESGGLQHAGANLPAL